jgi:uroporphyrinogen III methyltransferase/synthase
VVTFTSSSTVRNLFEALGPSEAAQALRGVAVACIGPVTAQTAHELGLEPAVVAEEYTIEGLLEALVRWRIEKGNWGN